LSLAVTFLKKIKAFERLKKKNTSILQDKTCDRTPCLCELKNNIQATFGAQVCVWRLRVRHGCTRCSDSGAGQQDRNLDLQRDIEETAEITSTLDF